MKCWTASTLIFSLVSAQVAPWQYLNAAARYLKLKTVKTDLKKKKKEKSFSSHFSTKIVWCICEYVYFY